MRGRSGLRLPACTAFLLGGTLAVPAPTRAQLISPGELTAAHGDLEGIRGCTNCHELRKRGIRAARCLSCHEPLAARIAAGRGLHARVSEQCGDCHKEHLGREADIVRFDPTTFDHASETGHALEGAHADVPCRDCHTSALVVDVATRLFKREHGALDRTWLGLPADCARCHMRADPHDGQFGDRACTECHSQTRWEPTERFDHDRARYRLAGAHRSVPCEGCHGGDGGRRARYRALAFGACTDCHEDHHDGAMGGACADCHGMEAWTRIDRTRFEGDFDHDATGHPLRGAHASLDCAACHDPGRTPSPGIAMTFVASDRPGAYPPPDAAECRSCHVDEHEGAFEERPGGPACAGCHVEDGWVPSTFDLFRHDETSFALAGAHVAVACTACHTPLEGGGWRFGIDETGCADCHAVDDPHEGQFGARDCTDCHTTETFSIDRFDHDRTSYPLTGAHTGVACAGCHVEERSASGRHFVRYSPVASSCEACHGGDR